VRLDAKTLASLCEKLNADPAFQEAAKSLSGRFIFEVGEDRYFLALEPGRCVEARVAAEADEAEFVIALDPAALGPGFDPVQALGRGQLKLKKGSLFALMPYAKAAKAIFKALA